jgi:hypothetical protein
VSYNSTGSGPGAKDWEKGLAVARSRATAMHIAYRLDNAIAECLVGHFLQAWQQVPFKYIVHGAMAACVNSPKETWQFARDNSEYYAHLDQNVNQAYTEAMNTLRGKTDIASQIMKFGMDLKGYCYKTQAVATFTSAYAHAMDTMYQDLPPDEARVKASRYADSVIRTTTESGSAMDMSPWERSPIGRNITQWMGPMIIQLNNYIYAVNESRNSMDVAAATGKLAVSGLATVSPMLLRTFFGGYLANALVFPFLKGKSPSLDDDKDKWSTWVMAKLATGWAEGIPLVREGTGFLEAKITGEFHRMSSFPAAQALTDFAKAPYDTYQYSQGKAKGETVLKDWANVGGWVFGLPTSEGTVVVKYLHDILTGEYDPKHVWSPVTDIIIPRHEKK